jgi:PTS system ascorbate-specific IIA component
MLGWVITCHDELAQEMLDRLEKVWSAGPVPGGQLLAQSQQQYVEPDDVRCAACHRLRGRGHFLTDKTGAAPYRAAALMSHKHTHCEVISGVSYPLLERMYLLRAR